MNDISKKSLRNKRLKLGYTHQEVADAIGNISGDDVKQCEENIANNLYVIISYYKKIRNISKLINFTS